MSAWGGSKAKQQRSHICSSTYIEDVLDYSPRLDLLGHVGCAALAEFVDGHGRLAALAVVTEIDFDLEFPGDTRVLHGRVGVHRRLGEFVDVILDEGGVQCEPADQLVLQAAFVHQPEVDVTAEERVVVHVNHYLLKLRLARLGAPPIRLL